MVFSVEDTIIDVMGEESCTRYAVLKVCGSYLFLDSFCILSFVDDDSVSRMGFLS